jgi:acetyl-CoA decarbonylase/synthase complex subunit gamma
MSFDRLRQALPGRNAWILVLDTKGVNVWCAAGKGTFGTEELVARIRSSGLERIINHRDLILPQLAGPGVAAHLVKKFSGFRIIYGPIRAVDLPAFLDDGLQATPEMRRKNFPLRERAVLVPIELVATFKVAAFVLPALFILGGLKGAEGFWANALNHGLFAVMAFLLAILLGGVFTPLLLPFLPGRAFALKGFFLSVPGVIFYLYFWDMGSAARVGQLEKLAWVLLIPGISAYLAMNFTGASTYTSLSGVKKEMRWAVPVEIGAAAAGLVLWLGALFLY